MKLPARTPDLAKIPEPLRDAYRQEGQVYVLDVEPVDGWGLDHVDKLRDQMGKALADAERKERAIAGFRKPDGTLHDLQALLASGAKVAELEQKLTESGKGKLDENVLAQRVAEAKRALEQDLQAARKDAEAARALRRQDHIRSEAANALMAARPAEKYQDLLLRQVMDALTVEEEQDGNISVRVRAEKGDGYRMSQESGSSGWMTAKEFTTKVLRSQYPDIFQGDGQSGAGVQSSRAASAANGRVTISSADCAFPERYAAAKEAAVKAGQSVPDIV